ncbi:MAG TPA: tetratricopeptide repeat protein [Gammaproteobacteria bacterium]|nr:tetratricopeptide repeat protein [Gammaproteobacteria bacterium]
MTESRVALDADELMHLALHATNQNQPEQAITHLKRVLELTPANGKAFYLLGALHAEIGLYERAIDEMTRAVELEPDLSTAHFQLGLLYITSGLVDEAEQAWRPLDSLGEDDPLYLFKRGMLHLVRDEFEACIADLNRGIEANTMNEDLNNDMRRVAGSAEEALRARQGAPAAEAPEPASPAAGGGRHILLSAYQRDDDNTH